MLQGQLLCKSKNHDERRLSLSLLLSLFVSFLEIDGVREKRDREGEKRERDRGKGVVFGSLDFHLFIVRDGDSRDDPFANKNHESDCAS